MEEPAGHFQMLIRSLIRTDAYPIAAKQKFGRCFGYLLLLVSIVWVAHAYRAFQFIESMRVVSMAKLKDRLPTIRIERGEVSIDAPEPCIIAEGVIEGRRKYMVAIDSTGKINPQDYELALILQKRALVTHNGVKTESVSLAQIKSFEMGPKDAEGWLHKIADVLAAATIFILPFWHLFAKLLTALFFSIAALLANASGSRGYEYRPLFQISLYALTPVVVLESVGHVIGHGLWFFGIILGLIFACLGTLAKSDPQVPAAV